MLIAKLEIDGEKPEVVEAADESSPSRKRELDADDVTEKRTSFKWLLNKLVREAKHEQAKTSHKIVVVSDIHMICSYIHVQCIFNRPKIHA